MGWATGYIEKLKQGDTVTFRPKGNSMTPRIKSGQLCTVEPVKDPKRLQQGSVVLCKVRGNEYLHLISAKRAEQYQISNNHGHVNGWITDSSIYGILIGLDP